MIDCVPQEECFVYNEDVFIVMADYTNTFYIEFRVVFIYNIYLDKTNVYVIRPENELFVCCSHVDIIEKIKPLTLAEAQLYFHRSGFTEENYGF